jgi:PAS domain S-box-containing protein
MAARDDTLQDRFKLLDGVPKRSRRWPLLLITLAFAAIVGGAAVWDASVRGGQPPWAMIAFGAVVTLGVLIAGETFLRWKDGLVGRYVELAERRVAEFEEANDPTLVISEAGRVEAVNAAAERLLGCKREALLRKPILDIIDVAADGEAPFITRLEAANGALASAPARELFVRRFDGGEAPVDVTIRPMHVEQTRYIAVYARDISDRKRVERLKDEFVSTVSHELRTPLTSIAGSLGLLIGGAVAPLPEGPARLVGIAHANCQRLVRLINDILDVEKIESGKMKFELAPLTLAEVAARSIDAVRGYADQLGVTLRLEADDDIDIRGDIDRLVQVGANLISNAIKFSKTGDAVEIRAARWGRLARITVQDHGPGVPEEFRGRIFSKFAQADSSDTRQRGGTGLGLVIAKEITERHGGRLWFDSVLGQGSAFHIDLPLATEMAESPTQGDGLGRLLVCEDDLDAGALLKQTLERDGFAVDVVTCAAEAQAALGVRNRYRALVLDLVLPDRHGLALIQALREAASTRELPIIVVSAQAELGREQAGALDVIDWMEKPVDVARLRRAVTTALARNKVARPTILHVDDDPDILTITATALAGSGEIVSVESLAAARAFLAVRTPDLVILDLALGDGSGLSLLPDLNDGAGLPIPVLIFSAHDTDANVLSRVAAVLTKSKTTLPNLADAVRRLIAPQAAPKPRPQRIAS